jgi:predicted carbohydrate-binding protein with CBM5 and CBM33 domain
MKNPNDAFSFVTPNLPAVSSYAWVFLIVFTCTELVCFGHGSVSDPVSRVYRIFLENPESPDRPVSADAIAVAGTQPFYDWSEVNRLVPDYAVDNLDAYRSLIPDGTLAGAGRDKYAGLNQVRDDWPSTLVNAGPYQVVFDAHVPHDPSFFRAFISRSGWTPNQPLAWDDLEELKGPEDFIRDGSLYRFGVDFPHRVGHHIFFVIWQRVDPAGEAFFSLSDIHFGDGNGYGNPENEPEADDSLPNDYLDGDIQASVSLKVQDDWGTGFTAEFTIQNLGGIPMNGWTLEFDLDRDISQLWNGALVRKEGIRYTVTHADWNQFIPAGGSTTLGFQASPGNMNADTLGPVQLNGVTLGDPQGPETEEPSPPQTIPTLSVANVGFMEGDGEVVDQCIQLNLSEPAAEMIHVTIVSENGSAMAGEDYQTVSKMAHFPPGATSASICISLQGDLDWEQDESFELILSNPMGAVLAQDRMTITILNDDAQSVPEQVPAEEIAFDWVVNDNWGSGYVAAATIYNHSDTPVSDWTVSFDLDVSIVNYWNASNASKSGVRHSFHHAAWNGTIPPGGSVSFGLQASSSADLEPVNIVINGESLSVEDDSADPDIIEGAPLEVFVIHAWGNGFTAEGSMFVESGVEGWQIAFDFPYAITDIWNATMVDQSNGRVVVRDSGYNASVSAGGEIVFGFNASGAGLDTAQIIYPAQTELSAHAHVEGIAD